MIRQIGVSNYGLYTLISSFLSYFLLDFGLGTAVSRYVSKYRAEGAQHKINDLLSIIVKAFTLIDVIIFLFLFVAFFFISDIFSGLTSEEIEKFKIIYCIAGCFSLLTFPFSYLNGVLLAYEKFVMLKSCDLLYRIIVVSLMVVCLFLGYGLYALVFVNSSVGLLLVFYKLRYILKIEEMHISFKYFNWNLLKELLKFSSWVFVIGIASRLMYNIIPTILGRYCNSTEVAIFSIAMMIEGYIYTFASALNGLFLNRVTSITTKSTDGKELTQLMIKVGRIQLIIVGVIISAFLVLGKQFIYLWLGDEFASSFYVTLFLIVPGLISLTQEIGNTALIAANELKYRALLYILASMVSIAGGYILTPHLGAIGAGVAVNISLIVCHIVGMNILYSKKLNIDVLDFFKKTILSFLPIMLFIISFVSLIIHFTSLSGWTGFLIYSILYVIVFLSLIWILFLNQEERGMIKVMLKK